LRYIQIKWLLQSPYDKVQGTGMKTERKLEGRVWIWGVFGDFGHIIMYS